MVGEEAAAARGKGKPRGAGEAAGDFSVFTLAADFCHIVSPLEMSSLCSSCSFLFRMNSLGGAKVLEPWSD